MSSNKAAPPVKLSTTERVMKGEFDKTEKSNRRVYVRSDVPQPAVTKLSVSDVFDGETGKPRPITVMRHFVREGRLEEETALAIILQAGALLREESTMIEIEAPVTGKTVTPHSHSHLLCSVW